ncbi:hypothetical protein ACFVWN_13535 [Nocardiopsis flavescens]|uniref:Uncharacterized protein n=1 Tax=Nocardiopsis flavescens TaxID=758803 RepID=A0A1M6FQH0_9ACTN|nr:hypothetical protein [Nocardiopsis flavescens]SHI99926.1 hypothetical protein SAMN05421803_103113 [Nocardiopsis flavescens]
MKRREQSQTEQLRQALAEREAQLQEARARLAALEDSTSLQVGRALTAAAKKPGRSLVRLPRDLYRLWRRSGSTRHSQQPRRPGAEPVRSFDADRQEARLLAGAAGGASDLLIAATVLGPQVQCALDPYIRSVPLRPHDAQIVMDGVDVDLVLVSASAAAPGSPWAHVGDPAAADRTRALHWVLESAAARGIPAVLLDDAPTAPGLRALGFTRVHRGDAGVPLHLFNPVAADLAEGPEAVFVRDTPAGPVPELLPGLGAGTVDADAPGLAEALRAARVAVVPAHGPRTEALSRRAQACGTRAVPYDRVAEETGETEGLAVTVPRLRAAAPTAGEQRTMLREVFLADATPVRLAEILSGLDFPPGTPGPELPLRGRAVAVLADPAGEADAEDLADSLLASRLRPAEVVVPDTAARLPGVQRLRAEGVTVRAARFSTPDTPEELTRGDGGAGLVGGLNPDRWAVLADRATAPWAHLWSGGMGPDRLADLVCAVECSDADAVGTVAAPAAAAAGRGLFDRPAGEQYVFVSSLIPELARTVLVRRGWNPAEWNRRGTRLLALGPDHGTGTDGNAQGPAHTAADAPTGAVG